jgi:hypothetical protein
MIRALKRKEKKAIKEEIKKLNTLLSVDIKTQRSLAAADKRSPLEQRRVE